MYMKRRIPLLMLSLLVVGCMRSVAQEMSPNYAKNARTAVSDVSNIVWGPSGINDGDVGPTKGWIGAWDGKNKPWAELVLPAASLTRLRIMPAQFRQVRANRFSRPKNISVDLFEARKYRQTLKFQMKDDEASMQEFVFTETKADTVRVTIDDVYGANAQIPGSVGFQEIELYGPPVYKVIRGPGTITGTTSTEASPSPDVYVPVIPSQPAPIPEPVTVVTPGSGANTATQDTTTTDQQAPDGKLDPEEKAILDELQKLMEMLRRKFMED
jgi:hypothetical protein